MQLAISESEQNRQIEGDSAISKHKLCNYLKAKYGYSVEEYSILSNEPEKAIVLYENGKEYFPNKPTYSGYWLARIRIDKKDYCVKYAVSSDNDQYPYKGADNIQAEELEHYVKQLVLKVLVNAPAEIQVTAGGLSG